jgi:hypothetical protein
VPVDGVNVSPAVKSIYHMALVGYGTRLVTPCRYSRFQVKPCLDAADPEERGVSRTEEAVIDPISFYTSIRWQTILTLTLY